MIFLTVRPDVIPEVLNDIRCYLSKGKILISLVARVKIDDIKNYLGFDYPIVRVMPNICASVGESMSSWIKSKKVNVSQTENVKFILQSIGEEIMLNDEKLFDVITVISGSGPAYFLYLAELFFDFARKMKLEQKLAEKLIEQTLAGTSALLFKTDKSVALLKREIASKGGTTEAVFRNLNKEKFGKIFLKALNAGYKRASSHGHEK